MARDVLSTVRQSLPRLSSSEARVAEAIIADPTIVVDLTITDLAQLCGTSLSTVARFCQTLGYTGYREFRMEVASALSREAAERDRFGLADADISPDDSAADVVAKIAFHEVLAIEQTAQGLDVEVFDRVVDAIAGAAHVDLYGFGASGLTAQDLQQKLARIGISAFCSVDVHLALVSAALRKPGDVAIGISHSGTHERDDPRPGRRPRGGRHDRRHHELARVADHRGRGRGAHDAGARVALPHGRHVEPHRAARARGLPVRARGAAPARGCRGAAAPHVRGDREPQGERAQAARLSGRD